VAVFIASILLAVQLPVANLYSKPDAEADVVTQAIYGASVGAIETAGDWLRVRTPDDYTGWIQRSSLRETKAAYAAFGRVARVDSLFAHLYREPSVTRHSPLLTVPFETALEVIAEPPDDDARWIQVRLVDERAAFVQRGDVTFRDAPLSLDETVALARRFLGLPYTWGGTSAFGFDCSGFTQMLCRRRGILIPRDSGPQARWDGSIPVSRDQLQPGDLLFFGATAQKVTHTGFYLGAGEFIHATTHGAPRVQLSRLDEPHWTALLVGSRRPK
jgi:cell wall-associated NlpC family hydrolase